MTHDTLPLITTLSAALGVALILGIVATRLRLPALVGYLVAGMAIGPFTPGIVASTDIASELAEIGVMLLMFGVGLHFSPRDLLDVRRIALPGALLQIAVATALGAGVALAWGWGIGGALVFGLSLSVASTVVLLRALESRGALDSLNGRIAVGWLVVEDLVMVLVLVILPPLSGALGGHAPEGGGTLGWTLIATLLKVGAFIALMLLGGRRLLPRLLWYVARHGSRELFTLCVVAVAVSIAYGAAALFGVSFALGAFFAGMVIRESEFAHRAAEESLPLREAFAVLFFVSVGMLFDPQILLRHPLQVLVVAAIIMLGKSVAAAVLVKVLRYPLNTALVVSASLAQIGEFSFILAGLGLSLGLLPREGQSLILAGALLSIALNPLMFSLVAPLERLLGGGPGAAEPLPRRTDPLTQLPDDTDDTLLTGQVVLVGYGRVGRRVGAALAERGIAHVVVETNREIVERLREHGTPAVYGDASEPEVLVQAHVARAGMVVVATPDIIDLPRMMSCARALNPGVEVIVRTHNEEEAELLGELVTAVFYAERELAQSMGEHVLKRYGVPG
ncbi:cation:proton antiporter domain-containing protein [Dyella sp. KULCS107]|uniref:cation:proton antiporter domain-containing protein n=1 Tax=unclassified Dyella TaxID=2634549 RepID=UPI003D6F8D4F